MYEHNALGYWSGLALCLTKVRSSRVRCPATALIVFAFCCVFKTRLNYSHLYAVPIQNLGPFFLPAIFICRADTKCMPKSFFFFSIILSVVSI